MSQDTRSRRAAYMRAWNAAHPEKVHAYREAHREERRANARAYRVTHPEYVHLHDTHRRATVAGVPCTLTPADVRALLAPMRCSVTGLELVRGRGRPGPLSPSLDRIEPARGYVPGNVRLTAHRFNTLRGDANVSRDAEFRDRVLAELGEVQT